LNIFFLIKVYTVKFVKEEENILSSDNFISFFNERKSLFEESNIKKYIFTNIKLSKENLSIFAAEITLLANQIFKRPITFELHYNSKKDENILISEFKENISKNHQVDIKKYSTIDENKVLTVQFINTKKIKA
jgi:hypothetical protein